MNRDFTFHAYVELLKAAINNEYKICTLEEYMREKSISSNLIILRHDVDRKPKNALMMAKIEHELGIKSSYYFRSRSLHDCRGIIMDISDLCHEVGYHYEDLAINKGDFENAIISFKKNINELRKFYPVKTICMHGSPLSKWDNRLIWNKYDYRDYGVLCEPYFDVDFNEVLYLSDTGRSWNNYNISLRDKASFRHNFRFSSTFEIISALNNSKHMPSKIMLNIHPQRWDNNHLAWFKEYIFQRIKNIIKFVLVRIYEKKNT